MEVIVTRLTSSVSVKQLKETTRHLSLVKMSKLDPHGNPIHHYESPVITYHFQSISPRLIISVPISTATNVITIIAVANKMKNRDKHFVMLLSYYKKQ